MNSMLFYTTALGPLVGDPTAMYAPPLRYKRVVLAVHRTPSTPRTHKLLQTLSRQGNTTHSGRGVLRSGGPNHSNPAVLIMFFVFLSKIELVASQPPSTHPLGLCWCIPPPGCGLPHHDRGTKITLKKRKHMLRQLGPRMPTFSFQSGRK